MKKQILIIGLAAASLTVQARQLSPDEALARMAGEAPAAVKRMAKAPGAMPKLQYTATDGTLAGAYVFSTGEKGFVVLGADDVAPAVLGYSDSSSFSADNMPDNMRVWLDGYASQIAWAANNGGRRNAPATVKQRPEVAPKITTRWNQDAPYWNKCPKVGTRYCYTGCVATAMAQIMNWHKWPEQPTGTITYVSRGLGTLSVNLDEIKFDWDNMLDTYDSKSPEECKDAVATLMMACGYGANMVYGTGGSGASSYIGAISMFKNFGYDLGLTLELRAWYGIEEWDDLVYEELTTNGPVYYDGSGTGGGHAFVCDGYSAADGLFHFNWGWAGMSDGYFRLSALNPGEQGAGGVAPGYNWEQSIMHGLKKAEEGSKPVYNFAPYAGVRSPMTSYEYVELGKHFTMLGYDTNDGFCNYSLHHIDGVGYGAELKNVVTGDKIYILSSQLSNENMDPWTRRLNIYCVLPEDLPEADYIVHPVYRIDGKWYNMRENKAFANYLNMHVADGKAYLSIGEPEARIFIDNFEMPEYFTSTSPFTIKAKIHNLGTSDYIGQIRAVFTTYNNETLKIEAQGSTFEVVVPAASETDVEYTSKITWGSVEDGEYYFCFGNAVTGEIVSDFKEAKVGNRYGKLKLGYQSFTIDGKDALDCDSVAVSATIHCPEGMYSGPIAMLISTSRRDFKPEWTLVSDKKFEFVAVESKDIDFTTYFREGVLGMTYYAVLAYSDGNGGFVPMADNPLSFTVASECTLPPIIERQYTSMLQTGKTWWYNTDKRPNNGTFENFEYGIQVGDEVELDGTKWYEIYMVLSADYPHNLTAPKFTKRNDFVCYMREDPKTKQVYMRYDFDRNAEFCNTPASRYAGAMLSWDKLPIYDFSLEAGDTFDYGYSEESVELEHFTVVSVDTVTNSGIDYRTMHITNEGIPCYLFIEGIGSDLGNMFAPYFSFEECASIVDYCDPVLRYVTDADGKIIYEGAGGLKLWEEYAESLVNPAPFDKHEYTKMLEVGKSWWYYLPANDTHDGTSGDYEFEFTITSVYEYQYGIYHIDLNRVGFYPHDGNAPVFSTGEIEGFKHSARMQEFPDMKVYSTARSASGAPIIIGEYFNVQDNLIYDFAAPAGTSYPFGLSDNIPYIDVEKVDTVSNSGIDYRVMHTSIGDIVEGIGAINGLVLDPLAKPAPGSKFGTPELRYVTTNSDKTPKVVYEAKGGRCLWDEIDAVLAPVAADSAEVWYNLQGMRIERPSAPGTYIVRSATGTRKVRLK